MLHVRGVPHEERSVKPFSHLQPRCYMVLLEMVSDPICMQDSNVAQRAE
jgi:hypothetical protein